MVDETTTKLSDAGSRSKKSEYVASKSILEEGNGADRRSNGNLEHAAGAIHKNFAETYDDNIRRTVDQASRVAMAYQQATQKTIANAQEIWGTGLNVVQCMHPLQRAYFDLCNQAISRNDRRQPSDIFQCRTPADVSEWQRDVYLDAGHDLMEMGKGLSHAMGQTFLDMMKIRGTA